MFELEQEAKKEHQNIAEYNSNLNIDAVYLVGENFHNIDFKPPKIKLYKTYNNLKETLQTLNVENSSILIKGSRDMTLERVLELL